jgi:hypothetical protein
MVEEISHYYSLYYLIIEDNENKELSFSFHIPYPIGKNIFPSPKELQKVIHEEQEGMFRFGRTLYQEEKITFKEKEVEKRMEKTLTKYKLYLRTDAVSRF